MVLFVGCSDAIIWNVANPRHDVWMGVYGVCLKSMVWVHGRREGFGLLSETRGLLSPCAG
jgi:hypothetical protein